MKRYDPMKPVIFAHIPKCAGTSFIKLLRKWYDKNYFHPHVDETRDTMLPHAPIKTSEGDWNPEVKCIHSHFDAGRGYGLPDHYPEIDQYFSVMRDPFDIVVSMYFFAKGRSSRGEFRYRGELIDIRDQYPSVADYVRKRPDWLYHHLPQDITLDNYREKISEHFVYLGLFEDMPTSIRQLGRVLGKPEIGMPRQNSSNYDEPIPESLRRQFYDEHPLLVAIYQVAKSTYRLDPDQLVRLRPSRLGRSRAGAMLASLFSR